MDKVITDSNLDQFAGELGEQWAYDQVAFLVDYLTQSPQSGEVYRFLIKLQPLVAKSKMSADMKNQYEKLILRLKYAALPLLESEEITELFKTNLLYSLTSDIDIRNRMHFLFFPTKVTKEDLSVKNLLVKAMEENTQIIGSINLQVNGKDLAPTAGNWVKLYKQASPEGDKGIFDVVRFLTENKFASKLDSDSKDLVKDLLRFYNWLRFQAINLSEVLEEVRPIRPNLASAKPVAPNIPSNQPYVSISSPKPVDVTPSPKKLFDEKLAAVSAPAHGQDLEALRQKLEQGKVSFASKAQPTPVIKMTPEEIKRETNTPELPSPKAPVPPPAPTPVPQAMKAPEPPKPHPMPSPAVPKMMSLKSLNDIKVMDDLKKVEMGHLRQAPISSQLQLIKTKIITLARANNVIPYYAVVAFEQSPMFKTYLEIGGSIIRDTTNDRNEAFRKAIAESGSDMTLQEFEAVADLRKEIERL